ncbi:LOW QUALITY PROTEIN: transcription termination factor MTERF8, chloroplastic-like [Rutidosis leptorrhynchoides]|uniref:LOW QUALITY PROTEIN: transcription termination factor MTERF8, chloroplastic-like n=1 Tax=Rutidosis leptorrhynchoides TaxID=125765 RepID=UPI003A9A4BD8
MVFQIKGSVKTKSIPLLNHTIWSVMDFTGNTKKTSPKKCDQSSFSSLSEPEMLCSSDSTGAVVKSGGSTWLDRLRSNRGFPTSSDDNLNLDHFLEAAAAHCNDANADDDRVTVNRNLKGMMILKKKKKDKGKELVGSANVMSNVLCELFNMGDGAGISKKKSLRKQKNPKFCFVVEKKSSWDWDSSLRKDENAQGGGATSASDNDVNLVSGVGIEVEEEVDDEKEKANGKELFGFSRSEVTVIDTSFAVWKFDKVLFRKKNVWKVRDKKGGSRILSRKNKRKFTAASSASNDRNANVVGSNKKPKLCPPQYVSHNSQDKKKGHVCKASSPNDRLSQVTRVRVESKASLSSYSALLSREILNFTVKPWTVEVRPLSGFRPSRYVLLHCSCVDSPATTTTTTRHFESGMLFDFLQNIGFDIKETEHMVSKNPALKFASFHSIRSRVHSLQSIGINGMAIYRLVMKNPNVLTSTEVDSFIQFVLSDLNGKIEPVQLQRLLSATDPTVLVGFDEKVELLLRVGIPQEKIAHVLNNVNLTKAICLKSVEDIEAIFTFFSPYNGTEIIVKLPAILNYDLETQLIPKVLFFKDLSGGDENATGTLLRKLPAILKYSLEHVTNHVEFFRSFAGLNDEQIFRIFFVFPGVVSASKERKLQPRVTFLKECGLDSNEIFKFLSQAPLFLGLSYEDNLVHKLAILVKIGYRYRTKDFAVAVGAVTRTSCLNMQSVIGLFLSYGFSFEDILDMSNKHPQILQYSPDSLEEKIEYLVEEMGRDVEELLTFPAFLGYRLDDRIKPRYEFKKKILGEGMSLNKLLTISAARFSPKKKRKGGAHNLTTE